MAVREIYRRVDPEFKHKLREVYGGETLKLCYQCGICTAICPISRFINVYRPNKILELAKLGIRDLHYSNAVLFCSACASCTKACPQGVRVHEVMYALKGLAAKEGNTEYFLSHEFEETLAALGKEIPFPIVYSWICLRSSIKETGRNDFDNLILDVLYNSLSRYNKTKAPLIKTSKNRTAVIGSGPAGLTAAWELGRMGLPVTVFESLPKPGGMLRVGIPEYRLPKDILDVEIERIKSLGIEIRTNTPVDEEMFCDLLKGEKYKAIFIATGAHTIRKLRIEGESLAGVVPVLDLLREYNLHGHTKVGKKVVIIGGGNVAMDTARAVLHCGAETVQLFCLEPSSEMPAHEWEVQEAAAEGVIINPSWGPRKILGDGQKVSGVEFIYCKSVFDDERKFCPLFDETKTQTVEADMVVSAIGQSPDLSFLGKRIDIARGAIVVDPLTMETSIPGVFAGGDAVLGTTSVIEAMVTGRTAAVSISRYLEGCI
ncbi:MAG: FAD-dependent oxidoreductase [Planctomycetes bacterium]|nr:FAD-dependent oxidoreductase [Planctomycetota bacterium]